MRIDIIKNKIMEIQDSLELIEKNLPDSFYDFQNMGLIKDGIYKRIEFCIENLIDIFYIINSDIKMEIPSDDSNLIDNLTRNNIINARAASIIKSMKGFRNLIVHRYGSINDEIAYAFLKENLNDFYYIIEQVNNIINKYCN